MSYTQGGERLEVECDFIAGCDGYHGVTRASVPKHAITLHERIYPVGWLGILADVPPVAAELVYANHARGFSLCSMRSRTRSRYYLQCPLDDDIDSWPDERFWDELRLRLPEKYADAPDHRAVDREEHRAAAQFRGRTDALWAAVPGRRRGAYRAADRCQGT